MQQSNIDLARSSMLLKSPRDTNAAHYGGPLSNFEDPNISHQLDNIHQDGLKVREPFHNTHLVAEKS